MKIYIWERLENLTGNYHSEGGLIIITNRNPQDAWKEDLERIAAEHPSNDLYLDPTYIIQTLPTPDTTLTTDATEEKIIIFPDTGCC